MHALRQGWCGGSGRGIVTSSATACRRVQPSQLSGAMTQRHQPQQHADEFSVARAVPPAAVTQQQQQQPQQLATNDVHKPLCDRRRYQHATLDNGLRVLAIQDAGGDAAFAAACASVQAGYFDDAAARLAGAAHFLEHMVHLGSAAFPDEREYKAFLAAHGGASNASTGMVHTRYHFKVHAGALPGALLRLGAALSSPLIAADSCAREVENVHAEYSRNTNSDSRKLLQLQRSLGQPPYSGFSTGSIKTLWEEPVAAGVCVPRVLQQLWASCYTAGGTTVAVVGPQEPEQLLQYVAVAFAGMPRAAADAGSHDVAPAAATATPERPRSSTGLGSSSSSSSSSMCDNEDAAADIAAVAAVHAKAAQAPSDPGSEDDACWDIAGGGQVAGFQQQQQRQQPQSLPSSAAPPPPPAAAAAAAAPPPAAAVPRYPLDVFDASSCGGQLVCVCPQRVLRELRLVWYIPSGATTHGAVKPWHWAAHLLGHEVPGSVAHLLKRQGLVQGLSVGMGDEVRLGRGWMFWGVTCQLTEAGEDAAQHVAATVFRGIQVLARCSDAQLQATWREAAALAALRFDWRDQSEPLSAAQAAAYALHYYPPDQVLSGPALMTQFVPQPLRWFVQQLTPSAVNIFWSSRRHDGAADSREPWYGARYSRRRLPDAWLASIQQYTAADAAAGADSSAVQPAAGHSTAAAEQQEGVHASLAVVFGQLHLPAANWALPRDLALRPPPAGSGAAAAADCPAPAPDALLSQPGLCAWHQQDTSFGLPKVHLKLHAVTAAVYATPEATVAARLLVAILQDVLLPTSTYPAELAGSYVSVSTGPGGLSVKVAGFQGVAQQLLLDVLCGLQTLTPVQVQQRFTTMAGRLKQALANWAKNNPVQHSEYAAHHLLLQQHHHNRQLLAAAEAATPGGVLQLQQELASGGGMHLDLLAYGNIARDEALALAQQVQRVMQPQGLPAGAWPPLRRVLRLAPPLLPPAGAAAAVAAVDGGGEVAGGVLGSALVTFCPDNPNPSNSNHAAYYIVQVGADDVASSVLLELFVQMAAKPAFHELRTCQRLGYSVHLASTALQRQLALELRVQSPAAPPRAIAAAVRAWLGGFRAELAALATGDKLDSYKQSLRGKYLDPPKSLREAARRAWSPIGSTRTLRWDRRHQKATVLAALQPQQLLEFYDAVVNPAGSRHHALCVQVHGGVASGADVVCAGQAGDAADGTAQLLREGNVAAFKQQCQLLPLPEMQLPPARSSL